ncbi:MAG: hypothetical protein HOB40_03370 [Candidatus Marinimicrobia bacterium]|jgi:hypothetical protein|nr:hypothetical protein [Candidatus Neomarinimicrobiota bacterium]MBT3502819.1 hypothetical protein [Candidatus Neomarinimicrobiota bacterium]MBT3839161.1 hypothetical protein [Candidatus Neomarinimicrobiota bacterium]MBT4000366.1 hypothetical protein [Candidatus Neomarinimicrobiota bacterium]MBT4283633.1 hypothetical protein [Candidatus Neomarinimicrobiota bacterium]
MPKTRKGIPKPKQKSYFKEYNFEITVILLIGLGVFLLIEELEIKHYLYEIVKTILFFIGDIIKVFRNGTFFIINKFEISDLVGISLIIFALFLVANRWRQRMIERYELLKDCPNCGGNLIRIRRDFNHKILGILYFVNVKHYNCKACNFKGIKLVKK